MKRLMTLLMCLLLTGCAALPAEERSFAVALGVAGGTGAWRVYARIPTYRTGGGYTTVSGEGDTLPHALAALDAAAPMQLHLGQLRLLVFSADTARSADFPAALATLSERHDLRADASLAITEDGLGALMDALKPATGARLSKSLDVLMETRLEQGTVPRAALADVIRMGDRQQPVLMNIALDGAEIALSGGWPIGSDGSAAWMLTPEEMQLLSLMQGRLRRGVLSLAEGTVRLTDVSADVELSVPTMETASVRLILGISASPLTEEALSQASATACLGLLGRLSAVGCDALGLGRQAIACARSMEDWHELDWPQRYREIVWTVSVGVEGAAE